MALLTVVNERQNPEWPACVKAPDLAAGELHLWLIPTSQSDAVQNRAYAILSSDEQARADRFRVTHARQQYIMAHAALRSLLADYQQSLASDLHFIEGKKGKPVLDTGHHPAPLHFNLSHSGGYALLGLCRDHSLGVDIEQQNDIRDTSGLIKRFFAPVEIRLLEELSGTALLDRFYRLWTCKEALLKAEGVGVAGGLDGFAIDLGQDMPLSTHWHKTKDTPEWSKPDWLLTELRVPDGYAGAVACDASVKRVLRMGFCSMFDPLTPTLSLM